MRRIFGWLAPCAIAALLLMLLIYPHAAMQGAMQGLSLWANNVLPALLPYIVLSQLLIESGALERVGRLFSAPVGALFRLPGAGAPALLLAWISGSPASAKIAGQMRAQGSFSDADTARFVAVATCTGPLFTVGAIGGMLSDARAGAAVWISVVLAAVLNGLLWRNRGARADIPPPAPAPLKPILRSLPKAVADASSACIAVGGMIALFSVAIAIARESGAIALIARPIAPLLGYPVAEAMLSGMLELTNGVSQVASLALPIEQRAALSAALASFGSLSIAAQAALFLKEAVPMRLFLLQRSTHALLGYLTALPVTAALFPGKAVFADRSGFCAPCIVIFLLAVIAASLSLYFLWPGLFLNRSRKKRAQGHACAGAARMGVRYGPRQRP